MISYKEESMLKEISKGCAALVFGMSVIYSSASYAFPTAPVTLVVGFPPGTSSDAVARILAEGLGAKWQQPVIVDNRPGAGGSIAAAQVARRGDTTGHTLMLSSSGPMAINPHVYKELNYDPLSDFVAVSQTTWLPYLLVTNGKKGFVDLDGLIGYAKKNPNDVTYASLGLGQTSHLLMEILQQKTGTSLTHVPYKGSSQAQTDVIGGNVDITFDTVVTALPHVKSGKLFAIGTSTRDRAKLAPDIPTLNELGLEKFNLGAWLGIFSAKDTPQAVVEEIHADIQDVLKDPQYNKRLTELGSEVIGSDSPEAFSKKVREDYETWGRTVKSINLEKN
jgi:tripartite-type tricarboxylate transporter receptor subunit TctC